MDTVGRNKNQIQKYVRNQLKDSDQLTSFEEYDPFMGERNKKGKQ